MQPDLEALPEASLNTRAARTFVDSSLACWFLGIHRSETLALHPLRGALFETLMMGEALKARATWS